MEARRLRRRRTRWRRTASFSKVPSPQRGWGWVARGWVAQGFSRPARTPTHEPLRRSLERGIRYLWSDTWPPPPGKKPSGTARENGSHHLRRRKPPCAAYKDTDFENCAERTESLDLPPFAGPDLPSFRSWAHAYPSVSRRAHRHCPTIHSTRRTRTDRPLSGPAPCCYGAPVRAGGAERGHEGGCRGARPRSPTLHCQSKIQKKWDCPTITLN